MPYKIFQVPSYGCTDTEQALNDFLGSHRILCVAREFVNAGTNSFWTFCVDYMDQGSGGKGNASGRRRNRIDYQEVLEPDEFALFARLRDLRKDLSESEGIPVYAVFTNEQLAQVVQKRVTSKESLHAISDHLKLNRRSRRRFRRKLSDLADAFDCDSLNDLAYQQRLTALLAFTRAGGVKSWQFRRNVLQE